MAISQEGWSPTCIQILWESEAERARLSVAGDENVATLIIETRQVSLFGRGALGRAQTLRSRGSKNPHGDGRLPLGIGGAFVVNRGSLTA